MHSHEAYNFEKCVSEKAINQDIYEKNAGLDHA